MNRRRRYRTEQPEGSVNCKETPSRPTNPIYSPPSGGNIIRYGIPNDYLCTILFSSFGEEDFHKGLHKIKYLQILFYYYFADNVAGATI